MNERGYYGSRRFVDPYVGSVIDDLKKHMSDADKKKFEAALEDNVSDEQIREAQAAGNEFAAPFYQRWTELLKAWPAERPLSVAQMIEIMDQTLRLAMAVEKTMKDMIQMVPAYWGAKLRAEGSLLQLQQGIAEAPKFRNLLSHYTEPAVVPGFRTWISQLFSRSGHGMTAVGFVAHVQKDWLKARDLLGHLGDAVTSAIQAALGLVKAGARAVKGAFDFVAWLAEHGKILGIVALGGVGVWGISKAASAAKR